MDINQDNAHIIWNIICALIAVCASIIAFFSKKQLADLEEKIDENEGEIKLMVQNMHTLALKVAEIDNSNKNNMLASSVAEIKSDLKDLSKSFHEFKVEVGRGNVKNPRSSRHDLD